MSLQNASETPDIATTSFAEMDNKKDQNIASSQHAKGGNQIEQSAVIRVANSTESRSSQNATDTPDIPEATSAETDVEGWVSVSLQDAKKDDQMEQSKTLPEVKPNQQEEPKETAATEFDPVKDEQSDPESHPQPPGKQSDPKNVEGAREDTKKYKIIVIGKTGTGKSSLCNTITETDEFPTGRAFSQITKKTQEKEMNFSGLDITVVDTPDISTETETEQKDTVREWKEKAEGYNYMIVLTVRCDTRYSPAEYEVYKQIKQLWGKDLCKRLVVAFTFGDAREDPSRDMKEELREVWPELKEVMEDAGNRYVVFNNKPGNKDKDPVIRLVEFMQQLELDLVKAGFLDMIKSGLTGLVTRARNRIWCSPFRQTSGTVSSSTSTMSPNST